MKYRYFVTHAGRVEADTQAEAEAAAQAEVEDGLSDMVAVEVEKIREKGEGDGN